LNTALARTTISETQMTMHKATHTKALRHLERRDEVMKRLIGKIGPCTLRYDADRFGVLVRSIISQQISGKAAISISTRLLSSLGQTEFTPEALRRARTQKLRNAGLSAAKARYVRDLADRVHRGDVPLDDLHELDDEEVIAKLLPVMGIGRWTAEMFLIFSLGRLDVLPLGDLGLCAGVQKQYGLRELPKKAELIERAEPWRPYRTIATWFIWRSFGNVPQSEK
jgi:DNA-3-methyladenine glycosylase II